MALEYKGEKFKDALAAILAKKHSQPIRVAEYFHNTDNTVDVNYSYREHGKTKGHTTKITFTQLIEALMNYS